MIYLDNASTTYIYPEVKEAIISELDYFGNPSNLYNIGYKQFEKIGKAREQMATHALRLYADAGLYHRLLCPDELLRHSFYT